VALLAAEWDGGDPEEIETRVNLTDWIHQVLLLVAVGSFGRQCVFHQVDIHQ